MAVLFVACVAVLAGICSAAPNSKIVGGSPTTIDQYPSIVQVESLGIFSGTWGQSCAASILNKYYVLSAAHCFDGMFYEPERRRIRAGSSYRNTGGILVNVKVEFNHPTYGSSGNDGDISVIRLVSPLTYSPAVQPSTIIAAGSFVPDNFPVVHVGWGTTSSGGTASSVLLDVTINIINNDLCRERYANASPPATVTENMICAGILDVGGKDACQGDSGGPLNYGEILIGVVSWGYGCADPHFPGVSTSVSPYSQWVQDIAS